MVEMTKIVTHEMDFSFLKTIFILMNQDPLFCYFPLMHEPLICGDLPSINLNKLRVLLLLI